MLETSPALVVAHLTGKDLETVIQEEVFTPLGVDNAYLAWNDRLAEVTSQGHRNGDQLTTKSKPEKPGMAYSLHIDAYNYAQFMIGIINGTAMNQTSYQAMLKSEVKTPDDENIAWSGLGIFIKETPYGKTYEHAGSNGDFESQFILSRDHKIGYVFLANNDQGYLFNQALETYLLKGNQQ
jgi:CubicO group peptidase (beta-lactamase class C family)